MQTTTSHMKPHAAAVSLIALLFGCGDMVLADGHAPAAAAAKVEAAKVEAAKVETADAKVRGVKLGEFQIRSHYPVEAQKSRVRFVLYAAVPSERSSQLQQLVASHEHKLRDQVI